MSAYKIETWTKKGFTEEEAKYQIAIRRPTNPLYWENKGYSKEESLFMSKNHQKNGAKKSAERPIEEIRKSSHRCKEYWMEAGLSEEDAILKVSESQSTFSLEKCLEKYGPIDGHVVWKGRQEKWQASIQAMPDEDKNVMNKKKSNWTTLKYYTDKFGESEGIINFKANLSLRGVTIFENISELKSYLDDVWGENFYLRYTTPKRFSSEVSKTSLELINYTESGFEIEDFISSNYKFESTDGRIAYRKNDSGAFHMHVGERSVLRSSHEISFFLLLEKHGFIIDVDFSIDRGYPNTQLRYDFYFPKKGIYVEICGDMGNPEYFQHMQFKKSTYGSFLLEKESEYEKFIIGTLK